MNKEQIFAAALVCILTASASQAQGDTSTAKPAKSGNVVTRDAKTAGTDVEKGSKGIVKGFEKGVRGVGHDIGKGAAYVGDETKKAAKGTEKGFAKINPIKKGAKAGSTKATPADSTK